MGSVVLDTSVVVAFLDDEDLLHDPADDAVKELRGRHVLIMPSIVMAESLVGPMKSGARHVSSARRMMTEAFEVRDLTEAMAVTGARLRASHSLGLADALIIATGIELKADVILTADRRWGGVDRRVKVLADS